MNASPLGYLNAAGTRAHSILPLTWFMLLVSIVVCLVIGILLWLGIQRRKVRGAEDLVRVPLTHDGNGVQWIRVGLIVSAVPLSVALVWTMFVLAAVAGPPVHPALVLDVTARQWWWDVRYNGNGPANSFQTANEIHIPVGQPVLVRLHAADVIHSFWVPKLTGKTDVIPGQVNQSWFEADSPGRYLGQCSEYCGYQHAHMQFEVVADTPQDFAAWTAAQLKPAQGPTTEQQTRGLALVQFRCGLCHQIRGTDAGAVMGPDLTHLMSRRTLGAGTLANNAGNLAGWVEAPQELKPGSQMPNQYLSAAELQDALAYLETLK
ncbi:MAG TPA: cytochrome c oxidase subunit II [Steroidobacteraceae bacterium]|jgi:cytochrome c oxidase subunit 2